MLWCTKIVFLFFFWYSKQYLYTTSRCDLIFFGEFNEQSFVILWVKWFKNESFWKRFTCTLICWLRAVLRINLYFCWLLLLPCRFGSLFSEVVWCKVSSDLERDGPRLFDWNAVPLIETGNWSTEFSSNCSEAPNGKILLLLNFVSKNKCISFSSKAVLESRPDLLKHFS